MSTDKQKKPTPLFIDDLGRVQGGGGGKPTTLALGEEGPSPIPTTQALYEEATTNYFGEEHG